MTRQGSAPKCHRLQFLNACSCQLLRRPASGGGAASRTGTGGKGSHLGDEGQDGPDARPTPATRHLRLLRVSSGQPVERGWPQQESRRPGAREHTRLGQGPAALTPDHRSGAWAEHTALPSVLDRSHGGSARVGVAADWWGPFGSPRATLSLYQLPPPTTSPEGPGPGSSPRAVSGKEEAEEAGERNWSRTESHRRAGSGPQAQRRQGEPGTPGQHFLAGRPARHSHTRTAPTRPASRFTGLTCPPS